MHLKVQYMRESLRFIRMEAGELFIDSYNDAYDTLFFWDATASYLDVYSLYLATDEYTYSSGTASIATAYFRAIDPGGCNLIYVRPETRLVTPDNQPIIIKSYGKATINID